MSQGLQHFRHGSVREASLVVTVCVVALTCLASCARPAAPTYVQEARQQHEETDLALEEGRLDDARHRLRPLVEQPAPSYVTAADARVLRLDAAYRLAEIELRASDPEAALRWAERGLLQERRRDFFVANLQIARGKALDALGRDVEAASAFHEALVINDELLQATLMGLQDGE